MTSMITPARTPPHYQGRRAAELVNPASAPSWRGACPASDMMSPAPVLWVRLWRIIRSFLA
jgi:hypothetical protein